MERVVAIANLVLALLPLIVEAVKKIESAFPDAGMGERKLSLLLQILEESGAGTDGFRDKFNEALPSITRVVGWVVALFNTSGVFKKQA